MARKRGRKKGSPNLKKRDGGFVNQHGVFFTPEQKKALERAVERSNRQRRKALTEDAKTPRIVAGKQIGGDKNQLQLMGKENEFIVAHQPRTLQKFETMRDYERFMQKQNRIQSGEYLKERARNYKRNFMQSLTDVYGDDAKDIVMKVRMMKPEEYIKMVQRDETLEISYVPSDQYVQGRLNQLRTALGMKEKDEYPNEYR